MNLNFRKKTKRVSVQMNIFAKGMRNGYDCMVSRGVYCAVIQFLRIYVNLYTLRRESTYLRALALEFEPWLCHLPSL